MKDRGTSMIVQQDSEYYLVDADGVKRFQVLTSSSSKWWKLVGKPLDFAWHPHSGTLKNNGKKC